MASSRTSLDSDIITLRQIFAFNPPNAPVPSSQVLVSVGNGAAYWDSVSSILPVSSFGQVRGTNGSTFNANLFNNVLNVSTIGIQGLLETYVDTRTSTLMVSNAAPPVQVALTAVPTVTRLAATQMPNAQTLSMSTTQSTLRFLGVGDIQLSTITDLRAVFFSISSFTATGYADLSGEARAWRPYTYSTNSTSAGYATFISSIPYSTVVGGTGWNWTSSIGENLPLSTVEPYPSLYSTGDVYFSTVSFHMGPFARYIHPNSTTKVYLELKPNYFFERMYLGQDAPLALIKEFSTFVQYESPRSGRQILSTSVMGDYMTSQMSNLYTSNYYNTPIKLELDTPTLMSNALLDGAAGARYTVYHRIAGGMANLVSDGYCGNVIGPRGGFSNIAPYFANRTPLQNGVFLHMYNQQGAAPPMPGP